MIFTNIAPVSAAGTKTRTATYTAAITVTTFTSPVSKTWKNTCIATTINVRRNTYRSTQQQFALDVIATAAEVENNYWTLVFSRQRVKILLALLAEAELSLEKMSARTELDATADVIFQNRELVTRSQASLASARNDLQLQQDRLLESRPEDCVDPGHGGLLHA